MGKISFFPMKFKQSDEELERLDKLQGQIKFAVQSIEHEEKDNKFMMVIRKQNLINILRSKIKLIKK